MSVNKDNIKKAYQKINEMASFPYSESEFEKQMQNDENAKGLYNAFQNQFGVNLLDAPDERSFIDSFRMNEVTQVAEPINSENVPNNGHDVMQRSNFVRQQSVLMPENVGGSTPIQEDTPQKMLQSEVNQIGQDKVTDALVIDDMLAQANQELADWNTRNSQFMTEYNHKKGYSMENDRMVYTEHFYPRFFGSQSKKDQDFVNANSAKYDELSRQRNAISNKIDLLETIKQYSDYDASIAKGEALSAMVDKKELSEDSMNKLRSISNDAEREEFLNALVGSGEISEETYKDIKSLGDTSNKNSLMYGLFKTGKLKDFATMGLTELSRAMDIREIAERYNNGLKLTDEEQSVLDIYNKLSQIESEDRSFWFDLGKGTQQSLRFMMELALTGGVGGLGKSLGTKGALELVKRDGKKKAIGMIAKNAGKRTVNNTLYQAAMTPVSPSSYIEFNNRITGLNLAGEELSMTDYVKELHKSYATIASDRFAESLSGVLDDVPVGSVLFDYRPTNKLIQKGLETIAKIKGTSAYKSTDNFLENIGVNSIPSEILEEVVATVSKAVTTGETEQLKELSDPEFYAQVAMQGILFGGMGALTKYTAGAISASSEEKVIKKSLDKSLSTLDGEQFSTPRMNELKSLLTDAIANGDFVGADGSLETGDVNNIYSQFREEVLLNGNNDDIKALNTADISVRYGLFNYGKNEAIKGYIKQRYGEFENEDGNVYEVTDTQGNQYFMIDSSDDVVILVDRATKEKIVRPKAEFEYGSVKQTNANEWAINEFLLNINNWKAEDNASQEAEIETNRPADALYINGAHANIERYNPETDTYTVKNELGEEVEYSIKDNGVTPVWYGTGPAVDGVATNNNETITETQIPTGNEDESTILRRDEDANSANSDYQAPRDENGKIIWSEVPMDKISDILNSAFPKEGRALGFINQRISETSKKLKSLQKREVPNSEDEYNIYMDSIDELQAEVDKWKEIKKEYTGAHTNEDVAVESIEQPSNDIAPIDTNKSVEYGNDGIIRDDSNEIVWTSVPQEKFKETIDAEIGADDALDYINMRAKRAKKRLSDLKKKTTPVSTSEFKAHKNAIKDAQNEFDYWENAKKTYNTAIQEAVEEVPVAETEQVFKNTSDSMLPEGVTPYTVGENIKQKYNDAPKAYGVEDTYTDADGNSYKGRWVVVEADAVTPSHNANTLSSSEGFPVTDKGRNVNDNDYSNKAGVVETMAANYDARALDEPVIVSEGAIVSGNNRTISRQLSAQKGTDSKYKEALPSKAQMRGISVEELGKFQNPTLVFELAEPVEYTTETFAKFNRPRSKTKSPVDMAIAIGKQDTSRLVGQVLSTIGEVEKLSELYQNQNKVAEIMKQVVESGIINQNEMPQFYSQEYGITDAGKDFIETLLIGSVINEDQIRILNSEGMKQYREKIVSAMLPIARNMKFEDNIGNRLNTAIKYLKEARDAKTDLRGILLDNPIFDAKEYEDLTIFTALMLQRKPSEFRDFINNLNDRLSLGGENLFGEQETAQSVLEDYKQQNKLTDNERETIRLAEQTRNSATQSVYGGVQADGTNANNRGEGVDGSSISKTEKQSVENGNIEQSELSLLGDSNEESGTGRPDVSGESRGNEPQQSTVRTSDNRGTDRTGNAEVSETVRHSEGERSNIDKSLSDRDLESLFKFSTDGSMSYDSKYDDLHDALFELAGYEFDIPAIKQRKINDLVSLAESYQGYPLADKILETAKGNAYLSISNKTLSNDTEAKQLATDSVLSALNESGIEVIEATDKQAKQVLQSTNGVEAQIVYHGSAAKFDKFDHSYMGTGEGAQAYGWGSYVTQVEGIGKSYAKTAAKKGDKVLMNGGDVTNWAPRTPALSLSPTQYVASCVMKYKDAARDFMQSRLDALYDGLKSDDLSENKRNLVDQAIQLVEGAIGVYDNNKWEYVSPTLNLYTVEIPDDNGSNYLAWDENISEERLTDIINNVYKVVKDNSSFDFETYKNSLETLRGYDGTVTGQDVYEITMNYASEFVAGAQKKASEILSKAGFTGVSVPAQFRTGGRADGAKNYVIFNENDLQIKDRIEFMKTPNGTIYGWTVGGKIYLTKDGFNPDTPIHEYTHIWANAMKQKNPKGWASIKNLLKGTPVWNEVINDENYSNIRDSEDSVASEVLSRISGKKNAEKMEKEAQKMIDEAKGSIGKARAQELIKRMKEALNKFWSWVGTELFKIESFDSVEQVADRILYDLLNKTAFDVSPNSQVELQIVTDAEQIAKLESSPKKTGYRNVVLNLDGTFGSPMASGLRSKGKDKVRTTSFEIGKWEQAEENPQLANEEGKITLVKPDGKSVADVDYNPYIHNRLDTVNAQFKQAWERPNLVYIETEVATTDLESGYKAEKAAKPVGVHKWNNGDLMLSRYDKPIRIVPWSEVADDWVERFKDRGVEFDIVPPALLPILTMRGVNILPPHKGMGKSCNDAYAEWQKNPLKKKEGIITDEQIEQLNKKYGVNTQENQEQTAQADTKENVGRTAEQKQALFDKAKEIFGTTNNFKVAGYMLPDGSLLDFSGRWEGGPGDARYTDHRAIGSGLYEASETDSNYDTNMYDFINQGAIRLMPESAGIYVSQPLTEKQEDRLASYIYRNNGEVILEIIDNDGNSISYIEYNRRTSPEKVLSDISNYFEKGIEPVQPEIRFRLADGPMGARQHSEEVMQESIDKMAQDLGVNAEYVSDENQLDKKGWYDPAIGKVYVNLAAHETIDDAKATYLHEVVGHFGLRGLLKDKFEKVMNDVFNSLPKDVQADLLKKYKNDKEVAAEEYLASMIENDVDPSLVEKILGFIREALRSMGINLDNYTNGDLEYLLWRSKNNLRENAGHVEAARWGAKNKETRYRTSMKPNTTANKHKFNWLDRRIQSLKDNAIAIKRFQNEVINRGGVINDGSDAYNQVPLSAKKAAFDIAFFDSNYYAPMLKQLTKVAKLFAKDGVSIFDARDKVVNFLYAKHAPERNRKITIDKIKETVFASYGSAIEQNNMTKFISDIIPVIYDKTYRNSNSSYSTSSLSSEQFDVYNDVMEIIKDWTSRHQIINESGVTDEQAERVIKNMYTTQDDEIKKELDALLRDIKLCNNYVLDSWLEYGLIGKNEYDKVSKMYDYYIPLRGWEEKEDIDYEGIGGNAYNRAGDVIALNRVAKGRTSKAESPIEYIRMMAISAAVSGNRNLIRRKAYNMVAENEELISDLATLNPNEYKQAKTRTQQKIHEVDVLVDGYKKTFAFKGELGGATALAVTGKNSQDLGWIGRKLSSLTRFQSQMLTSLNAAFLPVNMVRDFGYGNLAYFIKYGGKDWSKFNKNYFIGFYESLRDVLGGKSNSKNSTLYQEYKRNGGQTGYVHIDDLERLKRNTNKLVRRYSNGINKVGAQAIDLIPQILKVIGEPMENAIRFAIYKTMVERGESPRQAAIAAGEITVNFNRKGTNRAFPMMYAFWNASMEGTSNFFKLMTGGDKNQKMRASFVAASLMALSFGLSMLAKANGDEYDDDEFEKMLEGLSDEDKELMRIQREFSNSYNRISPYIKNTNILIPTSSRTKDGDIKYIAIPLPASFRVITASGRMLADLVSGDITAKEFFSEMFFNSIGEFVPMDIEALEMTAGKGTALERFLRIASPTPTRASFEVATNTDFMGNPIYREPYINSPKELNKPLFTRAYDDTPELWIGAAKELNRWLGGTDEVSAKAQIAENGLLEKNWKTILAEYLDKMNISNPAAVDHVLKGFFGGFYTFGMKMYKYATDDEPIPAEETFIVDRFVKVPTAKPGMKSYFELINDAEELKVVLESGERQVGIDYEKSEIIVAIAERSKKKVKEFNEIIYTIKGIDEPTDEAKKLLDETTKARDEIIKLAGAAYEYVKAEANETNTRNRN